MHINPFILTPYLSKDLFCDREEETEKLIAYLESGRNITLISPRRLGKTGLIYRVFDEIAIRNIGYDTLYVDISATSSIDGFIKALSEAVACNLKNKNRVSSFIKTLGGIRPLISYDAMTGQPELSFTYRTDSEKQTTLKSILSYLESRGNTVVVAIDEFQQIREYEGVNMEAVLRTHIQNLHNVRFIFCGSKQHIMFDMFSNAKRPFYESTVTVPLHKLDVDKYAEFISRLFLKNGKTIDDETTRFIIKWTKDHTFYTQSLCNEAFMISRKTVTMEDVFTASRNLLMAGREYYLEIQRLISAHQWNLLKAIAKEEYVRQPTSSFFIRKHGLTSGASVLKSLNALVEKELVLITNTTDGPVYSVYNVFLSRYLEILQ